MKKLRAWFASPAGKRFFNIFYSLGAAIVVLGAMCKIIHFPGANAIFITGMLIEVFVFALSAFDTSSYDNTPVTVARGISIDDRDTEYYTSGTGTVQTAGTVSSSVGGGQANAGQGTGTVVSGSSGGSGGSSVIVVGGGGSGSGGTGSATVTSGSAVSGGTSSGTIVVGGGVSGGGSGVSSGSGTAGGVQQGSVVMSDENLGTSAQEYATNVSSAAESLEDFSKTMQSLNEASQKILETYNQIAETNNMGETMNTVRYINDSLVRIKNLYDGAIGDSYMFKEEMSKMTRHIEALNNVYARLLQAMTSNNNPNIPPTTY